MTEEQDESPTSEDHQFEPQKLTSESHPHEPQKSALSSASGLRHDRNTAKISGETIDVVGEATGEFSMTATGTAAIELREIQQSIGKRKEGEWVRELFDKQNLEGDGTVVLGQALAVGSNGLSTVFSGGMRSLGPLTKVGSGTWTLTGASTYNRRTTISEGALTVNNATGSATGTGPVLVDAGTLGVAASLQGRLQ